MRVALYARCSSERQAEKDLSIPAQLKALEKHALKNGWDVVQKFVDEAESARTADRPAFQEMIALAKQKEPPHSTSKCNTCGFKGFRRCLINQSIK